jgi:uncharacterized repeat protein (TIGR03803 family)
MMLSAQEFFMKSVRLLSLCVLVASQLALAQLTRPTATGHPTAHRHFTADQAWQSSPEQVLYTFQGGSDGVDPIGNLVFDSAGNLYGVTAGGGTGAPNSGYGTVYELSPNGSGGWTKTTLYNFQGGSDGTGPSAGLIFDGAGNLYGTTTLGGGGNPSICTEGCGTVFKLSPNGSGGWSETVLYSFQGGTADGLQPAGLNFDKSGNLYGVTTYGGIGCPNVGCGMVYELSPGGSGWTEKVLYQFQGKSDGNFPQPLLTWDDSGNLYGSTLGFLAGTVFELSPGSGGWSETTLYAASSISGGYGFNGGLIFDRSGNLWGTTYFGGPSEACGNNGCGVVFELSPNGQGSWTETVAFNSPVIGDGAAAQAGLVLDQSGNFYGTTTEGGGNTCNGQGCGNGVVFELSPAGNGTSTQTVLYTFQRGSDGGYPNSGLILDQAGHLYGVTALGGDASCGYYGCGVVFQVTNGPLSYFSPAAINFGNQAVSFLSSPLSVTLTNTGNKPMSVSSIQITGTNAGEFSQQNNCPASLAVNASCTISATFLSTVAGSASASLTVTDNAQGSPQSVPLTGTGVIDVTFSPPAVSFPGQYVGTSGLPQAVILTNNTNSPITIKTVTASPGDFAAISGCGTVVQPGDYCSVGVFFDPTTSGTRTGVLTVTDTAPTGQQTVTLTGTGEDFSMNAGSSPSASVAPGETAKYTVAVVPSGGFCQSVTLTCAGAPLDASCSISPSSVQLSGSQPVPVTISVSTAGSSAAITYPANFSQRSMIAMWLVLAGLPGIVLLGSKNKKKTSRITCAIVLLCLISGIAMWTNCGGGGMGNNSSSTGGTGTSGSSGPSTPAGSYNLTVVGTFSQGSANLVHSTKLTLVVK